jgi:RNA polymerase sigma factor for flagellar operon FliA
MDRQAIFLSNQDTIERIVATICRRHIVPKSVQEDFASYTNVRLMKDDYAIFGKFQGRSSLVTFLSVVITNFFHDYRNDLWGRWRPSAEARRLGALALKLEALLYRDGYTLAEAIQKLKTAGGDLPPDLELFRLAARIPVRNRPRPVSPNAADNAPANDSADALTIQNELEAQRANAAQEMERALASLPVEDGLILRLRFFDGISVADIARMLGTKQKPLYRRIDTNLQRLREILEERGINRELVHAILSQ